MKDYINLIPQGFILRRQCESGGLGDRMREAMLAIFIDNNYNRACLIVCDIPDLKAENLEHAFNALNYNDAVIALSSTAVTG
ncbi:MAG: DUF2064 domain-containing protein [Synergistaceae bacterium]|nr:DUF2064 domain-containing protein [Synergistaceae bacterium]MBQ3625684.1 DUF2064 domain-containing protein [Synergistaceae bacterium]MBQ4418931.1 DUF2064 domain-containing protein [Synergistaceae bacterium]MBQ6910289.1 DUF2064 domain-containing protein [Synergistaceae bacterium]MBQ7569366.1 DUF2064 domain-containing protein [Synergistaceae bacterium]